MDSLRTRPYNTHVDLLRSVEHHAKNDKYPLYLKVKKLRLIQSRIKVSTK